jgi:hypothetical protein
MGRLGHADWKAGDGGISVWLETPAFFFPLPQYSRESKLIAPGKIFL